MAQAVNHSALSAGPVPIPRECEAAVLALNNAHATELSWLDPARLAAMLRDAFYARQIGDTAAFLLAFDEHAAYDSPNYLWFRARYPRFVYVDRVAVAPTARGHGLARRLYASLINRATAHGYDVLGCEVNLDPPNPASDRFHAALGFTEIGTAAIQGGKVVRYLALALPPAEPPHPFE